MIVLDHIAIAATALNDGTAWVAEKLGVTLQPGGKHDRFGTHNTLLGMGDLYLEVITLDPDAPPTGRPAWFGLDHFTGPPQLANWICRAPDLQKHAAITGPAIALTRGDLSWQLTGPDDGSLPYGGAFPTLIQWDKGSAHPTARLADSGVRLTHWQVFHPEADKIAGLIDVPDPRVSFTVGPAGFRARFDTPNGPREL